MILKLKRGDVQTPFFMPDATRGFVKSLSLEDLKQTGAEVLVVNTFHLYLSPGLEVIRKAGGIHNFINWRGPLLSDSGGFQVFSLIHRKNRAGKIHDDHVEFRSPYDGLKHKLTPRKSIQIQFDLGVDMMVCFDDCPPNHSNAHKLRASVERTIAWARECKDEYEKQIKIRKIKTNEKPLLFGVVQGGADLKLREYCAQELIKIDFDGYGFGAMPVDKDGNFMDEILQRTAEFLPNDKPRFALGIGRIKDIVKCINWGWDMFDCVIPTREGRHGRVIDNWSLDNNEITCKRKNLINARFRNDFNDFAPNSKIKDLKKISNAFMHHAFKTKDPMAGRLGSLRNLEEYYKVINLFRNEDIKNN